MGLVRQAPKVKLTPEASHANGRHACTLQRLARRHGTYEQTHHKGPEPPKQHGQRTDVSTSQTDDKSWPVIQVALPTLCAPGKASWWSLGSDGVREHDTPSRHPAGMREHEGWR